uniref:ADF-H domain-containing protein n=1 Tax=Chromera velia CCMP2878 TaxID=1169474 RepID=A0A0G4I211_9ALVE|eukprot:Cvel_10253.t1-p1 / transcript=Cvel_10253.t1 / gene=Cvel_10253 / organism=Chromera_velia_CCMP2878 / gene_product=Actin-depolymerizing factor 8, putative / transcript_product=Actin-depolymerizing factor 8, putative / location=Cvel_scaffold614:64684-66673(-) / protein_length=119 / sequence_SO=supercontig / SO=protein_coding / is_pseudo=false
MKIRSKYRYLIFKMIGDKKLEIESEGPKEATYSDFTKALPDDGCRYAVVDVPYTLPDGRAQSKLVFFHWAPDNGASVKDKMVYSSAKVAIKDRLAGTQREVQANERDELDEATIVKLVQ